MGHNDIAYEDNNQELSHTFDNEVQNRIVIDGLKWLASRRANKKSENPLFTAFKN